MMNTPDPSPGLAMDRPALLAALRARNARPNRGVGAGDGGVPLCTAIDRHLPGGGLGRAALHEVLAADPEAAAGFCALLLARLGGSVAWIAPEPVTWPSGLTRFGLSPAGLLLVRATRREDALWAMEECLRCPGIAGAVLEAEGLEPDATRRLQQAAEAGGGLGLLLRPDMEEESGPAAALTRWRVSTVAGSGGAQDLGDPRWSLDLLRCRGSRPQRWEVTWRPAAERLDVETAERLDLDVAERPDLDMAERLDADAEAPLNHDGTAWPQPRKRAAGRPAVLPARTRRQAR